MRNTIQEVSERRVVLLLLSLSLTTLTHNAPDRMEKKTYLQKLALLSQTASIFWWEIQLKLREYVMNMLILIRSKIKLRTWTDQWYLKLWAQRKTSCSMSIDMQYLDLPARYLSWQTGFYCSTNWSSLSLSFEMSASDLFWNDGRKYLKMKYTKWEERNFINT